MILKADWEACITEASQHDSTAVASCTVSNTSWLKLWDMAQDNGSHGTNALYTLLKQRQSFNHVPAVSVGLNWKFTTTPSVTTPSVNPELITNSLSYASTDIFI